MTFSYATAQNYIDIAPSTKVSISVDLPPTRAHILISSDFFPSFHSQFLILKWKMGRVKITCIA